MQTSDETLLFQSSSSILDKERRSRKTEALAKRGCPLITGKVIYALVEGRTILTAESGGFARRLDVESGKTLQSYKGHAGPVTSLAVARILSRPSNSELLVTGSWDKTIRLWNFQSGKQLWCLEGHTDFVKSVLIWQGPEHHLLISTSSDRTVRVWDLKPLAQDKQPVCVQVLRDHTRPVTCSAARLGPRPAIYTGDSLGTIIEWSIPPDGQLKFLQSFSAHETSITTVKVVEDGLWTASMDKTAAFRSWTAFNSPISLPHSSYVHCLLPLPPQISQDKVLTGSEDEEIRIWRVDTSPPRVISTVSGHAGQVTVLKALPLRIHDWVVVSAGLDGTIRRWSLDELLNPPPDTAVGEEGLQTMLTAEEEQELAELMDD